MNNTPMTCPGCGATAETCCQAAQNRAATANALAELSARQAKALGEATTTLASIAAAAGAAERLREEYLLTDSGQPRMNLGAPGSVARKAQEDVGTLVRVLSRIRQTAAPKETT